MVRLDDFVDSIPKAELHLHLEGSVPWSLVQTWSLDPLPDRPDWWDKDHRFESFGDFASILRSTWRPYLNHPEGIAEACGIIFADLQNQNAKYVEISFGLGAYSFSVQEVVKAMKSGIPNGMEVRVFAGISRDRDLDTMLNLARVALRSDELDGIDLHGDESVGNLADFKPIYEEARERGLMTKAHAGEFDSAESVRRTVSTLGVTRVEHGIAAAEDPSVVAFLKEQNVALDVCPWSNVKLKAARDLKSHPIQALHRAGIRVTVNTDDPTAFGQTLTDELRWLVTETGMSAAEVADIAGNGFQLANLPEETRSLHLQKIAECLNSFQSEV